METEKDEQERHNFPRTYQIAKSTRQFFNGLAIFLLVLFGVMSVLHLAGFMAHPLRHRDLALMDSLVAFFAMWSGWWANRRVILHENAIEVIGWWSEHSFERAEIRAIRMGRLPVITGGGSYYVIVPFDKDKGELKLPPFLHMDSLFFTWIRTIPRMNEPPNS